MIFDKNVSFTSIMSEHLGYNHSSLTITQRCFRDGMDKFLEQWLSLFYIISPAGYTYDDPNDVPNYEISLIPVSVLLLLIEQIIRFFQRKRMSRFQDLITNFGSALIFLLARVFLLSVVVTIFSTVYENYRIVDLPLHSVWTWFLSLLMVEFVYYWTHRALHEFNILWAAHQFHHMAEDVNITTTIRDSIVDLVIYDIFPLPLAVIIPPPILVVHIQFSLIYQIWLHNEVVGNLGFIEYIINTPRQHRVHHGKNPYCIDKNYGALIMIWDRLFGTYQTEQDKIIFGVVSPTPKTFDQMSLQFGYYQDVWQKFNSVQGCGNKLSALFKGPGWAPGKPRLGLISDVPEPDKTQPKYSYDPYIPFWKVVYVAIHSGLVLLGFYLLADHPLVRFSPMKGLIGMFYVILVFTAFGAIFDNRRYTGLLEVFRCVVYFPFDYHFISSINWEIGRNEYLLLNFTLWLVRTVHIVSIIFWLFYQFAVCLQTPASEGTEFVAEEKAKDIESETSSQIRRNSSQTVCSIFLVLLGIIGFWMAWMTRMDSCAQMLNEWNFS